jgi:hypothetical protein
MISWIGLCCGFVLASRIMEHKLSGLGSMGTEETIGTKRCLHDEYPLERVLLGSITFFLNGFCYGVFSFS